MLTYVRRCYIDDNKSGGDMGIYVDNARIKWSGRVWCHLVADSLAELHAFAKPLANEACRYHRNAKHPHYDVTLRVRDLAIRLGAEEANRRKIIECARLLREEIERSRAHKSVRQQALFD